jgi:hypothetical protein
MTIFWFSESGFSAEVAVESVLGTGKPIDSLRKSA